MGELVGRGGGGGGGGGGGKKKKFEQIRAENSELRIQNSEGPLTPTLSPEYRGEGVAVEDDDDDLPAPGKVWESGGRSLVEMMKAGPVVVEAKRVVVQKSNVEAVDEKDLPAVWGKLVEVLK